MIYEFAATQDLHGYDKPWAPGEGYNQFDIDKGVCALTVLNPADTFTDIDKVSVVPGFHREGYIRATASDFEYSINGGAVTFLTKRLYYGIAFMIPVDAESDYSFSFVRSTETTNYLSYYDEDGIFISYASGGSLTSGTFTTPATAAYALVNIVVPLNTSCTLSNIQIESGSTIHPYGPYANICLPDGFNIWDPTNAEYVQVYAGYVNANTRELYLRPVYKEYAGEELVGPWMSSLDEYSEDATPTEGAFVIDFGGELTSHEITPFMLQTLLDSLGIRQHFTNGAGLLNSLMDQAQGRVRSEEELLHLSRPLKVIPIGDQLPAGITFKPISKDVLPGLPGKFIR